MIRCASLCQGIHHFFPRKILLSCIIINICMADSANAHPTQVRTKALHDDVRHRYTPAPNPDHTHTLLHNAVSFHQSCVVTIIIIHHCAGIATGAAITYFSDLLWPMYIAASIDGCTSCMFGLGQVCKHPFLFSTDL